MRLLLRWIINALVLLGVAYLVPGVIVVNFYAALIAAIILGLVNVLIKPVLVILTLPINILTLGLFTLIINALLFWFVGTVVQGFAVEGFAAAFVGALLLSISSWITSAFLK